MLKSIQSGHSQNKGCVKTRNITKPEISHVLLLFTQIKQTKNKMNRYHFNVTITGVKFKVNINANNSISAYGKVKRNYPMASKITLIRAERIWNRNML